MYEDFRSLNQLMVTLHSRLNNEKMKGKNGSKEGSESFTGTKSYAEAEKMLTNGYLEILGTLKDDVKAKSKISSKYAEELSHPIPHNGIVGYAACVPAAIQGLPNSMISVDRKPMKRKTISILYGISGACTIKAEWFSEAGSALLSAIDIIEKSGIQTQLKLSFFMGKENNEMVFPTVVIKNYGERYSLQKISFPLAHPSMFRRIGFKWLETTPDTKQNFRHGYGTPVRYEEAEKNVKKKANEYLLTPDWIHDHGCSVEAILKKLEVIK